VALSDPPLRLLARHAIGHLADELDRDGEDLFVVEALRDELAIERPHQDRDPTLSVVLHGNYEPARERDSAIPTPAVKPSRFRCVRTLHFAVTDRLRRHDTAMKQLLLLVAAITCANCVADPELATDEQGLSYPAQLSICRNDLANGEYTLYIQASGMSPYSEVDLAANYWNQYASEHLVFVRGTTTCGGGVYLSASIPYGDDAPGNLSGVTVDDVALGVQIHVTVPANQTCTTMTWLTNTQSACGSGGGGGGGGGSGPGGSHLLQ